MKRPPPRPRPPLPVEVEEVEAPSARQVARRAQREDGDRSALLSKRLMEVPPSTLAKLELDAYLLAAVKQARAIKSHSARRREERSLASVIRGSDTVGLEARLASVLETGVADHRSFHRVERWRDRLIAEGEAALPALLADLPATAQLPLVKLVTDAQREAATGKPAGAKRALFRQLMNVVKPPPAS